MAVVPKRWVWVRQNPIDVIVVFLTPPFLPASLEAARLFRLLRLLRLLRIVPAMRRLVTVEGMKYAGVLAATTVIAGGAAFAAVEKDQGLSSWDGIWWAVTTVTTVGYGDVYPETTSGRVMAMTIMAVGIGFVALLTAFVADRFIRKEVVEEVEEREDQILAKLDAIDARLDRLERAVGD